MLSVWLSDLYLFPFCFPKEQSLVTMDPSSCHKMRAQNILVRQKHTICKKKKKIQDVKKSLNQEHQHKAEAELELPFRITPQSSLHLQSLARFSASVLIQPRSHLYPVEEKNFQLWWGSAGLPPALFACSVTQSCLALCDHMGYSMPGFPVCHQLLELAQTHVHPVSDAIQPSNPLLSPSPPAFNLSQYQGLFQWVGSLHQVAKILEFQLQHQSFQWIFRTDFL